MENKKKSLLKAAISGAILVGLTGSAYAVKTEAEREATKKRETAAGKVKCAGRIIAGLNDCPTSEHACAGMGHEDNDKEEFIWLPRGTCERLVGINIIGDKKKEDITKQEVVIKEETVTKKDEVIKKEKIKKKNSKKVVVKKKRS